MPVSVNGTVEVPPGVATDGKVFINVYHAWALDGELRHALEYIDSFESSSGAFSFDFEYPSAGGEGLIIYAWLDNDGDGILCTPSDRDDLAGLTEVTPFPAAEVSVRIELTAPCAGPDWFYPPAT